MAVVVMAVVVMAVVVTAVVVTAAVGVAVVIGVAAGIMAVAGAGGQRSDSVSEQQRSPIPIMHIPPTLTGTVTPIVPRTPITRIAIRTMAVTHITKGG